MKVTRATGEAKETVPFLNMISRCAVPIESECPYLSQGDLEKIRTSLGLPPMDDFETITQETIDEFEFDEKNVSVAARSQAVYQGTGYAIIGIEIADIENAIASDHEVVLDISTNWFTDSGGVWQYRADPSAQGHTILIVGYNRDSKIFTFKNSWGSGGLDSMSYDCFSKIAAGACTLNGVVSPLRGPQVLSRWLGKWNSDHDGWRGKLTIRRVTNFRDSGTSAPTKIGNWYAPDNTRRDINGSFHENDLQCIYWMASNSDKVRPGQIIGQPFTVENYSWEATKCAGTTVWGDSSFGVILDRSGIPISSNNGDSKEWIGSWSMNHDGWRGILTVSDFINIRLPPGLTLTIVRASYKGADGTIYSVAGLRDASNSHHLSITIAFPDNNQTFDLYLFSQELDKAAGNTVWSDKTFGVQLYKIV